MSQWNVPDVDGQPVTVETEDDIVVLDGRKLDAPAARQLRLHLGAAIREASNADRHP